MKFVENLIICDSAQKKAAPITKNIIIFRIFGALSKQIKNHY